jgi:uncharacterized protein YxjI
MNENQKQEGEQMDYFTEPHYLIRKKILKILGGAFHVYDSNDKVVGYTKMKAFKLKEDLRMYTGEDMSQEIFSIKARNIIDFSATYDVIDSDTGEKIGALKRKGLKSIIKDEWQILDISDNEIGLIQEDSMVLALIRRFLTALVPQNYDCVVNGVKACEFRQNFNPFVVKINVDFQSGVEVNRKLIMAAGVLLCAIEGKQD